MRTLVEASAAFDQGAGIGRYARNILSRLIDGSPDDWTLVRAPVSRGAEPKFNPPDPANVRTVTLPFNRRNADRLWFRLNAPVDIRLFAGSADVLYSPDFTAPPMFGVPRMITVHDLAFMTHPRQTTDALRRFLENVVPRQVERADKVAVVSHATRDDVMRLLSVPEEKIVVARNGVDERFFEAQALDPATRKQFGIPGRYLLMVGTIEPRKNHLAAMQAIEHAGMGIDLPLVIAGRPGWGHEAIMERARDMQARGLVVLPEYVPDAVLPGLYAGATAVLYPSWTEGFGLPIAEALASGSPVITGTAPALREVGGPEALYAEPEDIDALAQHIRDIAGRTTTADDRARRQAWIRQFSWDFSTSTVLENLKSLSRR